MLKNREHGELISHMIMLVISIMVIWFMLNITFSFASNARNVQTDTLRITIQNAEPWAVANPVKARAYTSSNLTYGDLVNTVASDKSGKIWDGMKNSKVQYIEKDNGEYTICVEDTKTDSDRPVYVYNTEIDVVALETICD